MRWKMVSDFALLGAMNVVVFVWNEELAGTERISLYEYVPSFIRKRTVTIEGTFDIEASENVYDAPPVIATSLKYHFASPLV